MLILNHEFPPVGGGASPVSFETAKAYAQHGHAVSVVTMRYRRLPAVELTDGVTIFRLRCVRRRPYICTVPEMMSFLLAARHFLRGHLQTHTYDVCHVHFIVPGGIIALWAKKTFALPYVVSAHGSDVLGYNQRFRGVYPLISHRWRDILRQARAITSPTEFLAQRIKNLEPDVPVTIVPHCVDPHRFPNLPKEQRILVVARLIELKGVQDILEALRRLPVEGWQVDIVGDGPYRATLEQKVRELRLSEHVTFHGWIENDSVRLRELYGRARVFVSASHSENMSVALLEAQAAGCWVIASNVGGTPEIVGADRLFQPTAIGELKHRLTTAMSAAERPRLRTDDQGWTRAIQQYEQLCFE